MLKFEDVDLFYGKIHALKKVSFEVPDGKVVALLGANGAGKTTILKTISGLLRPASGRIIFKGRQIQSLSVEDIVKLGISHAPEGRRIFPGLTVYGNLEVATSSWRLRGQDISEELERVYTLFLKLRERKSQLGWSLSGGEQQMLCIGRALMARPKLLLLDEPSLGLAPQLVQAIFRTIKLINQRGVTILLVEQNASMALKVAHYGYVMENGRVVMEGFSQELINNKEVKEAYLGR